jgi:pilus assembly protein Flp/PilA
MFFIRCRIGFSLAAAKFRRQTLIADRRGVTAVEYAIIAGVIVTAIVISVPAIGPELASTFSTVSHQL